MADRAVDVLLVGGGPAAAACAGQLREEGFGGSVLLAARELDPPYQRPPISKGYLLGRSSREDALLPLPADVEVLTRTSVMKLDTAAREAMLSTKQTVAFDRALVATGANVRRLPLDGSDLDGLHYLRALRNADRLREDAEGAERVVLVGGSFIACEVAAALTEMGLKATLVFPEEAPLALPFGARVGALIQRVLEAHGVEVVSGEGVARLEGAGRVERVVCASGRELDCQLVVVGAGAIPDAMLARSSGLELGESGGVRCSSRLETSAPGIYAAGDVCEYDSVVHGRRLRVEHHEVAVSQGRAAARNMLGADAAYDEVPYFWSDIGDWLTLESVGPAIDGWDEEVVSGTLDGGAFTVWYVRGGRLAAAVTAGRSADLDEARRLLRSGEAVDRAALAAA